MIDFLSLPLRGPCIAEQMHPLGQKYWFDPIPNFHLKTFYGLGGSVGPNNKIKLRVNNLHENV